MCTEKLCETEFSNTRITASGNVLLQKLGDEAVLLNLDDEHYYGLNEVGARFWDLLEQYDNLSDIVEAILAEYDVDEATVHNNIRALLIDLIEKGLVNASCD